MKQQTNSSGVELIAAERQEQIEKHGRTLDKDRKINTDCQLASAASLLLQKSFEPQNDNEDAAMDSIFREIIPVGWDKDIYHKIFDKPYKERLIIAGSLIAAELDRINDVSGVTPSEKEVTITCTNCGRVERVMAVNGLFSITPHLCYESGIIEDKYRI